MISEDLQNKINLLRTLARRENADLKEVVEPILDNMQISVEQLKEWENNLPIYSLAGAI